MYIYGRNGVFEALNSGAPIEKIYIQFSAQGGAIENIKKYAKKEKIPCTVLDNKKFGDLERYAAPREAVTQGVLALRQMYKTQELEIFIDECDMSTNPVVVILDGIKDPQNFGAIIRSAECSGVKAIIRPSRNSSPVSPIVLKTSAGALEHVEIITVSNLNS